MSATQNLDQIIATAQTVKAELAVPVPPPPPPPPPPTTIRFTPGIAGDRGQPDETQIAALGAKLVRAEFALGESPAWLATFDAFLQAHGSHLQPLVGFYGRVPNPGEAASLSKALAVLSPRKIEWGNETCFSYQFADNSEATVKARAAAYARSVAEASAVLAPLGHGLIVQAEDGGSGTPIWTDAMFAAVPDLASRVAGWTIHPYGPTGPAKMLRMIATLAKHGEAKLPIDVTEWGVSSDNGRTLGDNYGWPTNLSYTAAAAVLNEYVGKLKATAGGRLRTFSVYKDHDGKPTGTSTDREAYFGAVRSDGSAKGAYTEAVKALLASGAA